MKTKKLVLAIAIFGGVLFTAEAADLINLNEQLTTKIDKKDIKVPGQNR
jgi:quinolinate synthase